MPLRSERASNVDLRGGLDLASTVNDIYPGACLGLLNFEPETAGGYRRIAGYERCDGRPAPSAAKYYTVVVADSSGIAVGATLTGDSSGATSEVVIKDDTTNTLGVTALSGNYTASESANGTTITTVEALSGQSDTTTDANWQLAAEDHYRSDIGAVSGDNNGFYAFQYESTKYAWRSDSSVMKLYKTSSSGWTEVTLFRILHFDAGTAVINEGDTATGATSSATGTVKKVVVYDGDWSTTDAEGYLVIDVTSGTFQDNEFIQVSAANKALVNGADFAISLSTDGHFQHIIHNFYGSASSRYIYGCDGVNYAWEFDGTVLTPILFKPTTGQTQPTYNKPKFVFAHKGHLFLAMPDGRLAHSSIGTPLIFSGLLGAAEFGLGDEITGMVSRAGDVLAVYTSSRTYGLYGTSSSDWNLRVISESFGAKAYSVQNLGTVYGLDETGLAPIERVLNYGDFEAATVSRRVKPILDLRSDLIVDSAVLKKRNQYRLFFSDGCVLLMSDDSFLEEGIPSFSELKIPDKPVFVSRSEDENNNEVILFGDADGYVYEMEKGYNFDGEAIEYGMRTAFADQDSAHLKKRYKRLFIDIDAGRNFTLNVSYELSFADFYTPTSDGQDVDFIGGGGFWSLANWDEFVWSAPVFSRQGIPLAGNGTNISVLLYGNDKITRPFVVQAYRVHYLLRRTER